MTDAPTPTKRLLYSREQAGELLGGISRPTLIRLEKTGKLKAVRLSKGATTKVYYSHENLERLAKGH